MDFQTLASSESADKIKCTSCKNYLSYFSITISQDHILCGRCPSSDVSIRDVSFEALAQFIRFPCRYESEGCSEELLPKEIPSHEENCKYQVIPCPLTKSVACVWQGPHYDLLDHYLKSHSDLVLKNKEFDLDLTKSENVRNVLEHKGAPLFLERKFDAEEKKLEFALYASVYEPKMKDVPCHLEIAYGEKSLRVKFHSSSEVEYDLKELNLVPIIDTFGDEELKCAKGRLVINDANFDLLSHQICTNCFVEYAVPPILNSQEINLFCLNCRQAFSYKDSKSNFPCKYTINGCTYVAEPQEIVKHQSVCQRKNLLVCPENTSGCKWDGTIKEITDHIQSSHSDLNLFRNGTIISVKLRTGVKYNRIIKFANRFFRLNYYVYHTLHERHCYYFEVQVIGPCSDDFGYEIVVLPIETTKKKRLVAGRMCSHMNELTELYNNSDYYCVFVQDQMTGFFSPPCNIDFRVKIFK